MGFSSKPPPIIPAPPPVTSNNADVAYAQSDQRRRQMGRQGYSSTLLATATPGLEAKKTLLGG